jgi:hypothetical protein
VGLILDTSTIVAWYWADSAERSIANTGELSLLPLAAKYLWVDQPSKPRPPIDDVIFYGSPSVYGAMGLASLLGDSYQSPERLRDAVKKLPHRYILESKPDPYIGIYKQWWQANKDSVKTGDFANLTIPSE